MSYRLDDIRHATPGRTTPREFCEEAMVLIEASLEMAELGRSSGTQDMPAEGEAGALWIGFDVADPDRAEAVIREAVKGTSYGAITAISRADAGQSVTPQTPATQKAAPTGAAPHCGYKPTDPVRPAWKPA